MVLLACKISNICKICILLTRGLSLLTGPLTNPNCTEIKSHNENDNIKNGINISDKIDEEISWIDRLPSINIGLSTIPNRTKSEIRSNHYNMSNKIDDKILCVDRLPSNKSNRIEREGCSDYCDICNMVSKEISITEDSQPNHSNPTRSRSEYYCDNTVDNNRNIGNGLGDKDLWLDNFEGSK